MHTNVEEKLAVNTGNMIAALSLQVAQLEVENKRLKTENDTLKITINKINKKGGKASEPQQNNSGNK